MRRKEWVQRNTEWLERHPWFVHHARELSALAFLGIGLALLVRHADWDFSWFSLAWGAGLLAACWVRRSFVLVLSLLLFGLSLTAKGSTAYGPLHLSAVVLAAIWLIPTFWEPRPWPRILRG